MTEPLVVRHAGHALGRPALLKTEERLRKITGLADQRMLRTKPGQESNLDGKNQGA